MVRYCEGGILRTPDYFTGMLMTMAPMTSLILKSRFGLSGWALWQPMQA